MPSTTGVYDDMDQQNLRLAAIDRQTQRDAAAAEKMNLATATPTEGRSFGFQSGANRPGGVAEKDYNLASAAGATLGEPTSYDSGRGAPTPIGVIRGTRQTFATDTGGPQLQEFATPQQAQQAFNRAQGIGEYRPAGQTLVEATAEANTKNPLYKAQKAALEQEMATKQQTVHGEAYNNWLSQELGAYDKDKGVFQLPKDERVARLQRMGNSMIQQGKPFDEVKAALEPEIHRYAYTPENIQGALSLIQQDTGKTGTPQQIAYFRSGSPQAMADLYPYIKRFQEQPKPGFWSRLTGGSTAGIPVTGNASPPQNLRDVTDQIVGP